MSVVRISPDALKKILSGKVKEDATCVVKFYSNECHMCHSLSPYFEDIAANEDYEDLHFFAFNVLDNPSIEATLDFNGVPTISVIKTTRGNLKPRIRVMPDPLNPHKKTWYTVGEINEFIKREGF
tara:strand:+ start:4925 stop:5299 length:375 start_codon:yes stop_codon:yes gene_type:complete